MNDTKKGGGNPFCTDCVEYESCAKILTPLKLNAEGKPVCFVQRPPKPARKVEPPSYWAGDGRGRLNGSR